jgi:hypothetical protein
LLPSIWKGLGSIKCHRLGSGSAVKSFTRVGRKFPEERDDEHIALATSRADVRRVFSFGSDLLFWSRLRRPRFQGRLGLLKQLATQFEILPYTRLARKP